MTAIADKVALTSLDTFIANAPHPAGVALLRHAFNDSSTGAVGLLSGALPPNAVAAVLFLL